MKIRMTGVGVGLLISCVLFSCKESGEYNQAESTRKMAARLQKIAEDANPEINLYINDKRLAYFLSQERPKGLRQQFELDRNIAIELLHAGQSQAAADKFSEILKRLHNREYGANFPVWSAKTLQEFLALSYLRMGEQDNCVFRHNTESCLLPIQGSGVHTVATGSRQAIQVYHEILRRYPNDFTSGWLMNIAYMTLGAYPDQVPPPWRIPPLVFESDYDIRRFPDIAPKLGLDVLGLLGGAIMEDFDGDGYLDIMASSYGLLDQLRFYKNNGDGSFSERTKASGLQGLVGGINLCHADYNNDGHPDVLVLRGGWMEKDGLHPNSLLHNNGDGTFTDVTEVSGLLSFHPTQTASWGDYDNDGWLDLFIGNETYKDNVHPCELYHNNGDGTFTEVAARHGLSVQGYVKGVVWGDYNNDGLLDLYISRLLEPNLLFRNDGNDGNGGWLFSDRTLEAGVSEPIRSFPVWFWDFDNDGWLDIFVSGYQASSGDVAKDYLRLPTKAERPRLYKNNRDGTFADVASEVGVDKVLLTMGCNFGDLDNDGWLDLYAGTGDPDFRSLMPNRMFRNFRGERFQDVTTSGGFGHLQKGHGVAFGDLDWDGDQDIYMVVGGAFTGDLFQNALFENPGHGNNWITLKLFGRESNRSAIGARVAVTVRTEGGPRTIHRVVGAGGSFGCSSLQQEIGLGKAPAIKSIEIRWPGGATQLFQDVRINRAYTITEGAKEPNALARAAIIF